MKHSASLFFLILFLGIHSFFIDPVCAVDFNIGAELRISDYLYDELDRYYGPPVKRFNYFLQQTRLDASVKGGMTTAVVQLYFNHLDQNNQPTGGYLWGSTGGPGPNIPFDSYIHQAYLQIPFPVGTVSAGRRLIRVGHGIIFNDTSDNLLLNFPFTLSGLSFNLDLAYLKLIEPDSINSGNPDDFDKNGYIVNLNVKLNETDAIGLFYAEEKEKGGVGFLIADTNALALGITAGGRAGVVDWTGELAQLTGYDGDYRVNKPRYGINAYLSGSTNVGFGRAGVEVLQIKGKRSTGETSFNSLAGDFAGGHGILLNDQTRFGGGVDLNSGMVDMGDPTNLGYWHFLSHNFTAIKGFIEFNPYKKVTLLMEIFPYVTVVDRGEITVNNLPLTNDQIGMEGNLTGTYPIDEHLKISAGSAYLKAGNALKEIAANTNTPAFGKNILKTYLSLTWTF